MERKSLQSLGGVCQDGLADTSLTATGALPVLAADDPAASRYLAAPNTRR